jgi:archaellum component FlaC
MSSNEELHDAVSATSSSMRDFGRILIETATSKMAANLNTFLDRQEQQSEAQMQRFEVAIKEAVSAEVTALRADFRSVHEAVSDLQHETELLHQGQAGIIQRVNALDDRQTKQWLENANSIKILDTRLKTAEQVLSDHNLSRDASIAERQELRRRDQELHDDVAALHEKIAALAATLDAVNKRLIENGKTTEPIS